MSRRGKFALLVGGALLVLGAWVVLSLGLGQVVPGTFGAVDATAEVVSGLLGGVGGLGLAAAFVLGGFSVLRGVRYGFARGALDVSWVLASAGLGHVVANGAGGVGGEVVGEAARTGFGTAGAFGVLGALALLLLAERVPMVRGKLAAAGGSLLPRARKVAADVRSRNRNSSAAVPDETGVAVARSQDEVESEPELALARDTIPEPVPCAGGVAPVVPVVPVVPGTAKARRRGVVGAFELPSTSLFEASPVGGGASEKQLWEEAEALESALASYDVRGKVEGVVPGPVVSTFEVSLPAGTKFSKVVGLAGDVGMQFGRKVRVVPARPGRVGFEVQNERRAAVGIRELLEDPGFEAARGSMSLPVVIGRDVRGHAVFVDLASMPHMIIAGSTGSGKSVAVNAMLCSLLMARTPEELRLVLVDPKVVELMPYSGVPHLLAPPVSDVDGAVRALGWCVREMERRYGLLASAGCKNIQTFNKKTSSARLPFIVVVVDELADLMVQDKKAVEPLLVRLGQKARAAGIHVVAATQRPSVDVVTGLIKSNFPARLGFRVAQAVDSRVVLDGDGAEALLGKGDALLKAGGDGVAARVQCPWVSEEDVERLAGHCKAQGPARYDAAVLAGDEVVVGSKGKKEGRVWS